MRLGVLGRQEHARDAAGRVEQALGDADVDDEGVGREGVVGLERRQVGGAGEAEGGLGRGDGEVRGEDEGAEAVGAGAEAVGVAGGQGERLDADDAEAAAVAGEVAFEDGRDLPAGAAEGEPVGERHPPAARRRDRRRGVAADDGGGAGVAGAGLGVQGLHAAPERGRDGEAGDEGEERDRVAPPVAEEGGEDVSGLIAEPARRGGGRGGRGGRRGGCCGWP